MRLQYEQKLARAKVNLKKFKEDSLKKGYPFPELADMLQQLDIDSLGEDKLLLWEQKIRAKYNELKKTYVPPTKKKVGLEDPFDGLVDARLAATSLYKTYSAVFKRIGEKTTNFREREREIQFRKNQQFGSLRWAQSESKQARPKDGTMSAHQLIQMGSYGPGAPKTTDLTTMSAGPGAPGAGADAASLTTQSVPVTTRESPAGTKYGSWNAGISLKPKKFSQSTRVNQREALEEVQQRMASTSTLFLSMMSWDEKICGNGTRRGQ